MDDAAYDAVVVGGRVAGPTTAALLGMRRQQQRDEHASPAFEETTRLGRDLSVLG
jgi:hypothetical protein